jgi:hypothetical protein
LIILNRLDLLMYLYYKIIFVKQLNLSLMTTSLICLRIICFVYLITSLHSSFSELSTTKAFLYVAIRPTEM